MIRREFDVGEGDAYNKVLMDRAERRLNNLGYFKKVRITNEPGSAPDRVVVNVDVEDQPTGAFSIGRLLDRRRLHRRGLGHRDELPRPRPVRAPRRQLGERTQGVDFSFTEPYFLGYRMAAGFDLFSKYTTDEHVRPYENRSTGGQLRSACRSPKSSASRCATRSTSRTSIPNTVQQPFNDCSFPIPPNAALGNPGTRAPNRTFCEGNGEASLAIKESAGETR